MGLKLITPPASLVVSVADMKAHLNINTSDFDTLIEFYISAATKHIDGDTWLSRALNPQTWELAYDQFSCGPIQIPLAPLISITSVIYINEQGNSTTISSAEYEVDNYNTPGWVIPGSDFPWPSPVMDTANALKIRFLAGYADGVPDDIKLAIKLMVGDAFAQRETFTEEASNPVPMSLTIKNLLGQYRVFR